MKPQNTAEAMSETSEKHTLKRMVRAGREGHEARMTSPSKALRQALARAAEAELELALKVSGVQSETLLPDGMLRSIDDEMLLIVLDGPEGVLGAAALDGPVVAGMIEKQTMGRVTEKAGIDRPPTATDAAMVAPFIDLMLRNMCEALGPESEFCAGFKFGARIESRRHIELLIDAAELHVMRAQLELEGGAKRGEYVMILPTLEARERLAAKAQAFELDDSHGAERVHGRQFSDGALMQAHANLRAIIGKQKFTLASFSALQVGDHISLAPHAIESITLDAGTGSAKYGPCKLGQQDGCRAVRLTFASAASGTHTSHDVARSEVPDTFALDDAAFGAETQDIGSIGDLPGLDGLGDMSELAAMGEGELGDPASTLTGDEAGLTDLPDMSMEGKDGLGADLGADLGDMSFEPMMEGLDGLESTDPLALPTLQMDGPVPLDPEVDLPEPKRSAG